jgi:hypothetical protein
MSPLRLQDHLRFRFAFSQARRDLINGIAAGVTIVIGYGIVGTLDYAEEQRQEAEAQAESARAITATLADCMNGTARFYQDGPHTDGHGKTGISCRKAEEFRL